MGHFKRAMEWQYPAEALGTELTAEEEQRVQHEAFMLQRSSVCPVLLITFVIY